MAVNTIKSYNSDNQAEVTVDHELKVTGNLTTNNSSVGPNGDPIPTDATLVAGKDDSGNLRPLEVDSATGELKVTGSVSGDVTPAGLRIAGRNTTMMVSTTAIALPAIPLANRNAMSIVNLSMTETLYIGFDTSVTADSVVGVTSGWEIGPNEGFNIDITETIPLYGIVASGSIMIKIMELS